MSNNLIIAEVLAVLAEVLEETDIAYIWGEDEREIDLEETQLRIMDKLRNRADYYRTN